MDSFTLVNVTMYRMDNSPLPMKSSTVRTTHTRSCWILVPYVMGHLTASGLGTTPRMPAQSDWAMRRSVKFPELGLSHSGYSMEI